MRLETFYPFLLSFLVTLLVTPISLVLLKKIKLFDDPKSHKHPAILHTKPIPRGGSIALVVGIIVTGFFFLPITNITVSLFLASLLALVVGIIDDKKDISPYIRFGSNILCALIVVQSGVTIAFVTNPLGGILHLNAIFLNLGALTIRFSDIAAIVWIIWVMNMLNWSKGVDGIMPGTVAISAIAIGILSLRFPLHEQNTYIAATLSFIIAGSSLGFLPYNFHPARIFPGYGATAVYLLLAAVSILSGAKLATAILVMGVPMIDGATTVLRRLLSGKSPFWHDNKHLHHLLLRIGLGPKRIALFYWSLSAILGLLSLSLSSREKLFAIIMILIIVGGGILFLHLALRSDNEKQSI